MANEALVLIEKYTIFITTVDEECIYKNMFI